MRFLFGFMLGAVLGATAATTISGTAAVSALRDSAAGATFWSGTGDRSGAASAPPDHPREE